MDTATCPMTWKFNADNKIGQFYGSTHLFPLLKESLSCTAGCPMHEKKVSLFQLFKWGREGICFLFLYHDQTWKFHFSTLEYILTPNFTYPS